MRGRSGAPRLAKLRQQIADLKDSTSDKDRALRKKLVAQYRAKQQQARDDVAVNGGSATVRRTQKPTAQAAVVAALEEDKAVLQSQSEDMRAHIAQLEDEIMVLNGEVDQLSSSRDNALAQVAMSPMGSDIGQELQRVLREKADVESDCEALLAGVASAQQGLEQSAEAIHVFQRTKMEDEVRLDQSRATIADMEVVVDELRGEYERATENHEEQRAGFLAQTDALTRDVEALAGSAATQRSAAADALRAELGEAQRQRAEDAATHAELREQLTTDMEAALVAAHEETDDTAAELERVRAAHAAALATARAESAGTVAAAEERAAARAKIARLESDLTDTRRMMAEHARVAAQQQQQRQADDDGSAADATEQREWLAAEHASAFAAHAEEHAAAMEQRLAEHADLHAGRHENALRATVASHEKEKDGLVLFHAAALDAAREEQAALTRAASAAGHASELSVALGAKVAERDAHWEAQLSDLRAQLDDQAAAHEGELALLKHHMTNQQQDAARALEDEKKGDVARARARVAGELAALQAAYANLEEELRAERAGGDARSEAHSELAAERANTARLESAAKANLARLQGFKERAAALMGAQEGESTRLAVALDDVQALRSELERTQREKAETARRIASSDVLSQRAALRVLREIAQRTFDALELDAASGALSLEQAATLRAAPRFAALAAVPFGGDERVTRAVWLANIEGAAAPRRAAAGAAAGVEEGSEAKTGSASTDADAVETAVRVSERAAAVRRLLYDVLAEARRAGAATLGSVQLALARAIAERDALRDEHGALCDAHSGLERRHSAAARDGEARAAVASELREALRASERDAAEARADAAESKVAHAETKTALAAECSASRAHEERARTQRSKFEASDTKVAALTSVVKELKAEVRRPSPLLIITRASLRLPLTPPLTSSPFLLPIDRSSRADKVARRGKARGEATLDVVARR